MAFDWKIQIDADRQWVVSGGIHSKQGDITIPTDQLVGMSALEIGQQVLALVETAELAGAQFEAECVIHYCGAHNWDAIDIAADKVLFSRFAGRTKDIDRALQIILEREANELARSARQRVIRQHRQEIASKYNDLFVAIGRRDGFHCAHCKATTDLSIDHVTALSVGGTNDFDNLQLLCRSCNSKKGAR